MPHVLPNPWCCGALREKWTKIIAPYDFQCIFTAITTTVTVDERASMRHACGRFFLLHSWQKSLLDYGVLPMSPLQTTALHPLKVAWEKKLHIYEGSICRHVQISKLHIIWTILLVNRTFTLFVYIPQDKGLFNIIFHFHVLFLARLLSPQYFPTVSSITSLCTVPPKEVVKGFLLLIAFCLFNYFINYDLKNRGI